MTQKPKTLDQQLAQLDKEIKQLQKEIKQLEQIYKPKPNSPSSDKPKKQNPTKKFVATLPSKQKPIQKVDSPAYE
jgi:hypothetical protein